MLLPLITVAAQPSIDALPRPLLAGYSLTAGVQTVRTEMEVGPPRVRRRTRMASDTVRLSWTFTREEMQAFREWYDDNAAGGAAWFRLPVADGFGGVAVREARFVTPWQATLLPNLAFKVSAELELR